MTEERAAEAGPGTQEAEQASRSGAARWLSILAAVVALIVLGRVAGDYVPVFARWVASLGIWGPLVFIVGYAVAVVGFVPGSVLTLAAGAIFGLAAGTVYVFVAATLGATAAFLIARFVARDWATRRLAGNERFQAIDDAIAEQGGRIVFLLRLSPVFPFSVLNYALGLTKVRLRDYVLACLGMIPGTLLYVYSGKVAGDVAAVAGGVQVERGAGYYAVLLAGLAATLLVTVLVTRMARRALQRATDTDVTAEA